MHPFRGWEQSRALPRRFHDLWLRAKRSTADTVKTSPGRERDETAVSVIVLSLPFCGGFDLSLQLFYSMLSTTISKPFPRRSMTINQPKSKAELQTSTVDLRLLCARRRSLRRLERLSPAGTSRASFLLKGNSNKKK